MRGICEEKEYTEQSRRIEQFKDLMKPCIPNLVHFDYIELLKNEGFFKAPASIHHHGNYEGGLFDHSFAVAQNLLSLTERLELKWGRKESPYIVGIFHDLCKMDDYVENNFSGEWGYRSSIVLPGHGEKSVMMLQRHVSLTEEEILCIRWHMGAFDDNRNWNNYGAAIEKYPNVLYTHTADMIASRILNI